MNPGIEKNTDDLRPRDLSPKERLQRIEGHYLALLEARPRSLRELAEVLGHGVGASPLMLPDDADPKAPWKRADLNNSEEIKRALLLSIPEHERDHSLAKLIRSEVERIESVR